MFVTIHFKKSFYPFDDNPCHIVVNSLFTLEFNKNDSIRSVNFERCCPWIFFVQCFTVILDDLLQSREGTTIGYYTRDNEGVV